MEFEKQLKSRFRKEIIEKIEEDFQRRWNNKSLLEENIRSMNFASIENAYSIYMESKMIGMKEKQLFKLFDEFEQAISPNSLMKIKESIELEEQEKTYIKYKEQCSCYQDGRCKGYCRSFNTKNFVRKNRSTINWRFFTSTRKRSSNK